MKSVLWVSGMLDDIHQFCIHNNLPKTAEALVTALHAFEVDTKSNEPPELAPVASGGEATISDVATRPTDRPVGSMAPLSPDEYNYN